MPKGKFKKNWKLFFYIKMFKKNNYRLLPQIVVYLQNGEVELAQGEKMILGSF